MILLGLARGIGGVILLIRGKETLPDIIASDMIVQSLALGLILIGILEIISAIGILFIKRAFWILGIAITIAFVIDGAVNGHLLFGKPGDLGTLANLTVAIVIISCLYIGRKFFQ